MAPVTDTKTPTDEGSNLVTSNDNTMETNVALVALVFAAIAFVAAFFQALLQYLTSNQRDKCMIGATGPWSKYTKTGWDLRRWRIVVQYPKLEFSTLALLRARMRAPENLGLWAIKNIPGLFKGLPSAQYYKVVHVGPGKSRSFFWYLEDSGRVARGTSGKLLTVWDLTVAQKVSWLWFCLTKRRSGPVFFARAGWCNIITALGVLPDHRLVDRYENADIIPSSVDVPIQIMGLFDLCLLCYITNIKDVKIDAALGTINGQNNFIRFNTQDIPGLGKAVTIDGDFEGLKQNLDVLDSTQLVDICLLAKGFFLGCGFNPSLDYFDESALVFGLAHRWDDEDWQRHHRDWFFLIYNSSLNGAERTKAFNKTSLTQQADNYSEYRRRNPTAECWTDAWLSLINSCNPTIIKYLAIMPFTGSWRGVPQKLFFTAYRPHVEEQRKKWISNSFVPRNGGVEPMLRIKEDVAIESALVTGEIPFLREVSEFCLTVNRLGILPEKYTWAWLPNRQIIRQWESKVCDHILETENCDLSLPDVVIKLLDGSLPSIERAKNYIKTSSGRFGIFNNYTVESAVLLSLLFVDCRVQAIWSLLEEEGGRFSKLQSEIGDVKFELTDDQLKSIGNAEGIDALTCDFIALWFELGNRVDLLGDSDRLFQSFFQVLDEWENDDQPCVGIPRFVESKSTEGIDTPNGARAQQIQSNNEPSTQKTMSTAQLTQPINPEQNSEDGIPRAVGEPVDPDSDSESRRSEPNFDFESSPYRAIKELKSRKEFVQWARGGDKGGTKRADLICRILVLLQLRIFLMDLSYLCHSDSSDAYLAERDAGIVLRVL
ncbi:hypothetical protein TWF481_000110 [Arthrobotrys musiformis]|uniref:Uncharacterized protein n=1 Tax=Arthrobotrys musiformis TaxID=47236 RepID=A0AAV9WLN2_9PEZI